MGEAPEDGTAAAAGPDPALPTVKRERGWLRAAGLFAVALSLSAIEPSVLVGVPFAFFVLAFPTRRLATLLAGVLAVMLVFGGGERAALWYAERGWAIILGGWFVALTVRWPESTFTDRALGSVGGAAAVVAILLGLQPGSWGVLDWLVSERMMAGVSTFLEALRVLRGEAGAVSSALVATVYQTAEVQALVFPALLGLASMAALGVAWWLYLRLAMGEDSALGPVREFRFNDHLVWFFIAGLVLVAVGRSGGWARTGSNAVVFMGTLYALRGAAVVLFFNGGMSLLGFVLLGVGLLFAWPVIGVGALVIGLGDTWLDLRERARELVA
jgi:hypothetical protein